jgi:hypothetical protein
VNYLEKIPEAGPERSFSEIRKIASPEKPDGFLLDCYAAHKTVVFDVALH